MREMSVWRGPAYTRLLAHPGILAGLPPLLLAAYWAGGEAGLVGSAVACSVAGLLAWFLILPGRRAGGIDGETGLPNRAAAVAELGELEARGEIAGRQVAVIAVGLDRVEDLRRQLGDASLSALLAEAATRIGSAVRGDDLVVRLDGVAFGIVLSHLRRADLEMLIQIAARVQRDLSEPFHAAGAKVHATVSVGLCLPNRAPGFTGAELLAGAERALAAARAETGGAIRAYSADLVDRDRRASELSASAAEAIARGEIRPWFQPQVSTDTGRVTGFEALARWERGAGEVVIPGDFLPALEAAGMTGRLNEMILTHALAALSDWDAAGLGVPGVAVNVCRHDLRNPRYVDQVRWELDRFDIDPGRLTLELREISAGDGPEDMSLRNLRALSTLGCRIDLDDFGTGSAPLGDLSRFAVRRIKIDRSFVARVDRDPDQQRMVSAIVTMAERLEIDTLAEGVETLGEHAMLAQLGCRHVQGYAVSAPMPAAEVPGWLERRTAQHALPEIIGGDRGVTGQGRDGKTA